MGKGKRVRALRKAEPRAKINKNMLPHLGDPDSPLYRRGGRPPQKLVAIAMNVRYLESRGLIKPFDE